jgi:3-phosphoshikimate 1-carboxyvinyltransferase
LRVKESDRLAATAAMLRVNGIVAEISGDDLIVHGGGPGGRAHDGGGGGVGSSDGGGSSKGRGGGLVATHMDHRIAMAALVLGLAAERPVTIDDVAMIATSFPGFAERMRALGADFVE